MNPQNMNKNYIVDFFYVFKICNGRNANLISQQIKTKLPHGRYFMR